VYQLVDVEIGTFKCKAGFVNHAAIIARGGGHIHYAVTGTEPKLKSQIFVKVETAPLNPANYFCGLHPFF
jgi:hypothetical protein